MKKISQSSFGFGHSNTPWKQETFKKDLQVTTTFTLRLFDVILVEEKFQFSLQKNWISFFPHTEFLLFCCQKQSIRERSTKNRCHKQKKTVQISVERHKNWGKNGNLRFYPHVKSWVMSIERLTSFCKSVVGLADNVWSVHFLFTLLVGRLNYASCRFLPLLKIYTL